MTKQDIIKYIAEHKLIEDIVTNVCGNKDDDLKDLVQDLYEDLFSKSEELLQKLYEEKSINYFLTRTVMNNVFSKSSRYYMTYKKNNKKKVNIDDLDVDKY